MLSLDLLKTCPAQTRMMNPLLEFPPTPYENSSLYTTSLSRYAQDAIQPHDFGQEEGRERIGDGRRAPLAERAGGRVVRIRPVPQRQVPRGVVQRPCESSQ